MPPRIYQLFVRLFGNVNGTNAYDGDLATNGCGRFDDLDDTALARLRELGATHLWLTGVLRQATLSDFSAVDPRLAADDPAIVKGRAGSPYAIKDYFDVAPELATDPAARLAEFRALLARIHAHGLAAVIDLVPNHVSRAYGSLVRPELDFGRHDDPTVFFAPSNNFFYLVDPAGEPLELRYPRGAPPRPGLDGRYPREDSSGPTRIPRATGNNQTAHRPSETDWYEVVKLNYGFDFVERTEHYDPIPRTWFQIDAVLAYWQALGVDGFRCDFAHWVPTAFWRWAIARARARAPVTFFAEVYDAADAVPGYSRAAFVEAGFDALYDARLYELVKGIHAAGKWCNDLDELLASGPLTGHQLRYAENHDERRAASPVTPGDPHDSGFGSADAGFAVTALVQLLGPEPTMIYNGQEVGEPGLGREGFGGDDGRTTIFDYWTMPALARWVNGHRHDGGASSPAERELRARYASLWNLLAEPALAAGGRESLQRANQAARDYGGRGQWVYGFLRHHGAQVFLVLVNLDAGAGYRPAVVVPAEALARVGLPVDATVLTLADRLSSFRTTAIADQLPTAGVTVDLPALAVRVLELAPLIDQGQRRVTDRMRTAPSTSRSLV